jgi:hypothetical protein
MMKTNHWHKMVVACSLAALTTVLLGGCESDGGSPAMPTDFRVGQFVDSPVQGLFFEAGTESGVTNTQGSFRYAMGTDIEFSIGDIVLGSASAARCMTPLDLVPGASGEGDPTVTNIARFLQTLDSDSNPNNGIMITEAVRNAAVGRFVEFHQTTAAFGQDPLVISAVSELTSLTVAGARPLVSAQEARRHLRQTLLAMLGGVYKGDLSGSDAGTWTFMVHAGGEVLGYGSWSDGTQFDILGQVGGITESITYLEGQLSNGIVFFGSVSFAGEVFASWEDPTNENVGTLSGARDGEL